MPPGIYRLPLELVRKVAAESSSHDLAALALTGRHFYAWVNPCLYEYNIKNEEADAAVWAASHGRLDTLLLLDAAKTGSSKPFVNKNWSGRAQYRWLMDRLRASRLPLEFTLLHLAAQGSPDATKTLLDVGADVQGGGEDGPHSYTPLWNALSQGDLEVAVILLKAGAKPFAHSDKDGNKDAPFRKQLRRRQRELHTPLLKYTLQEDNTTTNSGQRGVLQRKVIRALLDFGCDINDNFIRYGEGRTPLTMAVRNSDSATVRLLLKRGAKANVKDRRPSALWHALGERAPAALAERVDKVTALVEHGADLLDQTIIYELIIRRSPRAMVDAVADTLGPENLTDSNKIPGVLAICCIFQERKLYDSIKRYAQPQARATDQDIRYALGQAAHQKRASVPAFLDEMRPGLTVDVVLDQWRGKMSSSLVKWLEGIRRLESGE
ncbi:hypothetical protein INS49_012714 [Diaporthe citri]|uniref:uncharacterized protein n=1 Tax=Diaporthe citri TaxID=83186 RepID=UPI001C804119|nr:uncharacterized protein INS49_012714 [Diaporthe citri]KAG6359194.1 hypothetical protein INS49_012714 [Diaporthe citri]